MGLVKWLTFGILMCQKKYRKKWKNARGWGMSRPTFILSCYREIKIEQLGRQK